MFTEFPVFNDDQFSNHDQCSSQSGNLWVASTSLLRDSCDSLRNDTHGKAEPKWNATFHTVSSQTNVLLVKNSGVLQRMVNSVVVVGRAGRDPEMRYFESGRVKTTFSVAVNRPTKEKETDWFDIEIWGRQAEVAGEYVRKGSLIGVEGRLDFNKWTDDQGTKHVKPLIKGNNIRLLGSKRDNASDFGGSEE